MFRKHITAPFYVPLRGCQATEEAIESYLVPLWAQVSYAKAVLRFGMVQSQRQRGNSPLR